MSKHVAEIRWQRKPGEDFLAGRYSRGHEVRFDGGMIMSCSASPDVVPAPWSDAAAVDPEELFIAALSNCHMLWFLDFARRAKIEVRAYFDRAEGELAKDARGRYAITRVTLRPFVDCDADQATLQELHHKAHDACFIANSARTNVSVEPRINEL
jgi:organic hydroperoxide reductase OsmC/OhrA